MLSFANAAEKVHAGLFGQALQALESGADLSTMDVYLCPVCGDLEFGNPPDRCPICGAPASKYQKIG
jgi:rubrerythrin